MIETVSKPNRLLDKKDETYHLNYAKHILSKIDKNVYNINTFRSIINWCFYKGDQWKFKEDLDAFFSDESGEVRNRIKVVNNTFRPFVEYYRGAAIRMNINFSASSVSMQSKDRRDDMLGKLKKATNIGIEHPELKDDLKKDFLIGDSEEETEDTFNNTYKDKYEITINNFLQEIKRRNDFEDLKNRLARSVVLNGIGILKEEDRFGEQVWDERDIKSFFFDTTCRRPDFLDAEFQGEFNFMSKVDIFEKYQNLSYVVKLQIENLKGFNINSIGIHNHFSFNWNNDSNNFKVPVYMVYWRDITKDVWGAVRDKDGYVSLEKIGEEFNFTDKDLIDENELILLKDEYSWIETALTVDGVLKSKREILLDTCRYCEFIPMEYVTGSSGDIILDFGERKYQNKYSYQKRFTEFPYKIYCWSYMDGEILSPLDDLISPQRYLNRVLSVAEGQINNSRGSGTIINKDIIDPDGGEEEMLRNMNLNKPVTVLGDVNNSVGSYDSTIKDGTFKLFNIADAMKRMSQDMIGAGEALSGGGGGYRVSGKAVQQNLNQGTIMQEPVFYAINKIIEQASDSIVNRGRRIYCANKKRLIYITGDNGYDELYFSKDFDTEDYRTKTIRTNEPEEERDAADQTLTYLVANKLIDAKTFAKGYGKSTISDIGKLIREYTYEMIEVQKEQEKQNKLQEQKSLEASKIEEMQGALQQDYNVTLDQSNKERDAVLKQQSNINKNLPKDNLQVQ